MGILYYGDARRPIRMEDRALAHVQAVTIAKLRRNESFSLSWSKPQSEGSGRSTVWLHASIPIEFEFDGSRRPTINREWLNVLSGLASSTSGLMLVPEPTRDAVEGSVSDDPAQ